MSKCPLWPDNEERAAAQLAKGRIIVIRQKIA